jgi:hypothetical protein
MKIIVYHSYLGCDTGCCGHRIECDKKDYFTFDHPDGDFYEFAKELLIERYGEEHIKDLDWENCKIQTDDTCY